MLKMILTLTGKYDIYIALPTPLDLNFIDALNQYKMLYFAPIACLFSAHLWCNYLKSSSNKIRVAYNNAFRLLHGIPRYVSARLCQIYANIPTFDAYSQYVIVFMGSIDELNCPKT